MTITVKVPKNTEQEYFEYISKKLKKKYGEETVIKKETDGDIIGGFIAEIDGTVYDTSIRSKLDEIKKAIKK